MIRQDRLIRQFVQLVQIDSETKHEGEIGAALKSLFSSLGTDVFEDDSMSETGHGCGNLICTLEATSGLQHIPVILFTSHMDTVVPGKGVQPILHDDGHITSDGTTVLGSDDKAGIAAMIEAIRVMKENNTAHGKIQFVLTVGEESGLVGSRAMNPQHLEAKFGYALDSNGQVGDIAVAAPAQAKIHATVWGKSAHAGVNPEDGISAIQLASKAISRMKLGRIDHETTANIGSFAGGGATNIVCERADIVAEARSLTMDKLHGQVQSMRSAFEKTAEETGGGVEFRSDIVYPSYRFDDTDPVVALAMKAMKSIGLTPRTFQSGGGSDANVFNGMGIKTVNLAVGYENIHTTEERIATNNLVKLAELIVAIAEIHR